MKNIFLTKISIHKVRHLEQFDIPLSTKEQKHLVLTGKNGSGKTSVLEALRDIFITGDTPENSSSKTISVKFPSGVQWKEAWRKNEFTLGFYPANYLITMGKPVGPQKIKFADRYAIEEYPGRLFLQHLVNLQAEKVSASNTGDTKTVNAIEQWFAMFETALQDVFADSTLQLQFDPTNANFLITTDTFDPFDFHMLSTGYARVLTIFCDLMLRMRRMQSMRGMSKNSPKTYDTQGIVFIDGLEVSLHVELQKRILPFLTGFFPHIQFVVSTQSPFIMNSLKDLVVYDLDRHMRVEDILAYPYEDIVERYDLSHYSDQIKHLLGEYEKLLNQKLKTEREEFRLLELGNYLAWIIHKFRQERKQ